MAERDMPAPGDVVGGKYEVEEVLGEGGMGAVFAAVHQLTQKRVALKWMLPELASDEEAVQRFLREAQAAGRIDHPNVVDVYDVGQHEGSWFLVMELLHGEPLSEAIEHGELEPQQVVQLLLPALRGVAAAHRHGVIHRDLKPDNIFLCRGSDGGYRMPKVLDFGISKLSAGDGSVNPRLTKTGAVVGTPYYMSPEQVRGSHSVDHRADVYAFGVILYESLTGRVPFNANTYSALILEIATGTPTPPRQLNPALPEGLATVVMRAMAREVDDRYPDIESLALALEPFAGGAQFYSMRPPPTGRRAASMSDTPTPFTSDSQIDIALPVSPWRSRLLVASALAVGGVVAGTLWLGGGGQGSDPLDEAALVPEAPSLAAAPAVTDAGVQETGTETVTGTEPAAGSETATATAEAATGPGPETATDSDSAAAAAKRTEAAARRKAAGERRRRRATRERSTSSRPAQLAPPPPSGATPAAPRPRPRARGRTGSLAVDEF